MLCGLDQAIVTVGKKWELETETMNSAMVGVKAQKQRCRAGVGFSRFMIINTFLQEFPQLWYLKPLPKHKCLSHPLSRAS